MATPKKRSGKIGNTEYEVTRNADGQHTGRAETKKGNRTTVTHHSAQKGMGPFKPWTRKDTTTKKEGTLPNGTKYSAEKRKTNAYSGSTTTDVKVKQPGRRVTLTKHRTQIPQDSEPGRGGKRMFVSKEQIGSNGMRKSIPVKHRTSKGKK